jgi:phage pi2 protein 07
MNETRHGLKTSEIRLEEKLPWDLNKKIGGWVKTPNKYGGDWSFVEGYGGYEKINGDWQWVLK